MMTTVLGACTFALIVGGGIVLLLSFRRHRANPKTSFMMAFINICLHPFRVFQIGLLKEPIVLEKAMKDAMSETKLSDFGDMSFVDNYEKISKFSFFKSLNFTNLGLVLGKLELSAGLFTRRLLLVDYFKQDLPVESIPVEAPLFVVGIGRSGTTFIHRLLSLDTEHVRSPLLWELVSPVPGVKGEYNAETRADFEKDRLQRAETTRMHIHYRNSLGDETMDHLHEYDSDIPEECIVALSDEIPLSYCFLYICFTHMSDFIKDIASSGIVAAYRTYKRILQLLSYQVGEGLSSSSPPKRWVVKSPLHSFFMKELLEVFPDANFVWPHRNPQRCLSSHCSLMRGLHLMNYERDSLDLATIGQCMLRENQHMISKCQPVIESIAPKRCAHVMYDDLIENPIDIVQQIYAHFGWKYTPQYEEKMKQYLAEDKAKRNAVKASFKDGNGQRKALNQHSLEEFGLKPSDMDTKVYNSYKQCYQLDRLKL